MAFLGYQVRASRTTALIYSVALARSRLPVAPPQSLPSHLANPLCLAKLLDGLALVIIAPFCPVIPPFLQADCTFHCNTGTSSSGTHPVTLYEAQVAREVAALGSKEIHAAPSSPESLLGIPSSYASSLC